jgi:hypothetical protein
MRARTLPVVLAVTALSAGLALPASAAPGDTLATVTITDGGLSITVPSPAQPVNLGTLVNHFPGGVISGSLGQVRVSDARNAAAGASWVASAISTAFTPDHDGATIGAVLVGYTVGSIIQEGTATYTANDPTHIEGSFPVLTATGITGSNSALWNPTINVTIPGGKRPGLYSGMITHSVA